MQKQREMKEVQAELELKKQQYHDRMQACREQEQQLAKKQAQIKASVLQFDKFVKENDGKRKRANQLALDEAKTRELKELEIIKLQEELVALKRKQQESQVGVQRDGQYERYLEQVVERSDEFGEPAAVINRYETLRAANEALLEKVQHNDGAIEEVRKQLHDFMKERQNEILYLNNQLAQFQQQIERIVNDASSQDALSDLKETDAKEKIRLYGQLNMAIHNLNSRARPRRIVNTSSLSDMLEATKIRMTDLIEVTKMYFGSDHGVYGATDYSDTSSPQPNGRLPPLKQGVNANGNGAGGAGDPVLNSGRSGRR
eukprot:TRINITY_DN4162_c0_g1_i1.p1 TRINITY_DN4162_c0_g1~~TRINITY_DN4162_c0_g1_i1.p1  ORF type:complete len:315 (-),score=72.13 TRINITY_DN4162_c0_g1_i1:236-1180(-)